MKSGKGIWLSYDLGVDGDYEALYLWLDNHEAVECGDSVAFFKFQAKGDLLVDLRKQIKRAVQLRPKDRVYVIYPKGDGNYKGRFLFGTRKHSPWEGYAGVPEVGEDEPL